MSVLVYVFGSFYCLLFADIIATKDNEAKRNNLYLYSEPNLHGHEENHQIINILDLRKNYNQKKSVMSDQIHNYDERKLDVPKNGHSIHKRDYYSQLNRGNNYENYPYYRDPYESFRPPPPPDRFHDRPPPPPPHDRFHDSPPPSPPHDRFHDRPPPPPPPDRFHDRPPPPPPSPPDGFHDRPPPPPDRPPHRYYADHERYYPSKNNLDPSPSQGKSPPSEYSSAYKENEHHSRSTRGGPERPYGGGPHHHGPRPPPHDGPWDGPYEGPRPPPHAGPPPHERPYERPPPHAGPAYGPPPDRPPPDRPPPERPPPDRPPYGRPPQGGPPQGGPPNGEPPPQGGPPHENPPHDSLTNPGPELYDIPFEKPHTVESSSQQTESLEESLLYENINSNNRENNGNLEYVNRSKENDFLTHGSQIDSQASTRPPLYLFQAQAVRPEE